MSYQIDKFFSGLPFVAIATISLGLVGGGVVLAETMRLAACPLCVIQRMLYLLLGIVALLALAVNQRLVARRLAAGVLSLIALTGASVAGYQVWIQRFAPATNCSGRPSWWEEIVEWAGEQVPILFKASGLCSDPAWKFLSLSIADWSLVWFTVLLVIAVRAALQKAR